MNNDSPKKDEILELIRLIESNKNKLFRKGDGLFEDGAIFAYITPFFCLILVMLLLIDSLESFSYEESIVEFIALAIALFALTASVNAYMQSTEKERIVKCNFKKMEKSVEDDKKLLLKALIKMKYRNREFNLEKAYKLNPEIFTIKRLTEILYE